MFLGQSANILRVFRSATNDVLRGAAGAEIKELPPAHAPEYPYNNVTATESGHLVEMDDTPGAERLNFHHRTGSHIEMRPDGTVKYVCKSKRQDVTVADQEIIVNGDYKITIAGGANIYVRNGVFEIQADNGLAINVKGQLKMKGDDIFLRADNKISLAAPRVDIGGVGKNANVPFISLPTGIVPIFGVLVPRVTGIFPAGSSVPKIPNSPNTASLGATSSILDIVGVIKSLGSVVGALAGTATSAAQFATNAGKSLALAKSLKDATGKPLIPEIDQPEQIPLSNPKVYNGKTVERALFRDRQFDTPEDVESGVSYVAHQNLSEELGDFESAVKDLPGEQNTQYIDNTPPTNEPPPWNAYSFGAGGTVTFTKDSTVVIGVNTKFTEDIAPGMYMTFPDAPFDIVNFPNAYPRVVSVANDTALVLSSPFTFNTTAGVTPYAFKYRPFKEYADKKIFNLTDALGSSGLTLNDMMKNYLEPVIEPEEMAIPKDQAITTQSSTSTGPSGPAGPADPNESESRRNPSPIGRRVT